MKYTTFRALMILLVGTVALGVLGAGVLLCGALAARQTDAVPTASPESHRGGGASDNTATAPAGSGWDARVVALLGQPANGDKRKDALGAGNPKVNLYADDGATSWNRAKVDLDRDEKWDEKWTVKDGSVERQVAPKDDEKYTQRFRWQDGVWVTKN